LSRGLRLPLEAWPEAEHHIQRAQELAPQFTAMSHAQWMALIHYEWAGSEAEFRRVMKEEPVDHRRPTKLAYSVLIPQGRLEEAQCEAQSSVEGEPSERGHRLVLALALAYAAMGDKPEALSWLDVAYKRRDWDLLQINCDFRLDCLRGERKVDELLKRMNLEP